MKKFLTSSKDTSLYEAYPNNNTGIDQIIEIGKLIDPLRVSSSTAYSTASVRALLSFDLPQATTVSANANYYLNLKLANATDIKRNQTLLVYPISRSWDEGSGVFYQDIQNVNDGATWTRCTSAISWSNAGGDFITNTTSASVTMSAYPLLDLKIDVTSIIRPIVSQSLQSTFYGLVVKFPSVDELDTMNYGNLKIFSSQTNTIFAPTLEIGWDNQTFTTGSLKPIPTLDVKITPSNLRETYTKGEVAKVLLNVRDEYPVKSFDSVLRYKNKYYLPTSSYYAITDVQSNVTIVDFGTDSKINTDATSSYIVLDTSPLYSGRFYTVKIKVDSGEYSRILTTDSMFKVN